MKKYITLIVMILVVRISYSQQNGTIKGKVIEQSTKQPIIGVTIVIQDTMLFASTDTTGVFIINNVPEGSHILKISILGFQEKLLTDIVVVRDKINYFETELLDDAKNMDEVVVSTFRNENNVMTPVSAYSFNREEIFRNPGAQGDIFRAIGILPGVSSSGGQFSAIAVRGQGVRDNVYMVDDIPMFEVSHLEGSSAFNDPNGGRFSIFAPRAIDNASFQGGGFAAQYGRKSASYLGLGIKEGNRETPSISGQFDLLGATLIYDGPSYLHKKTSVFATARYQNFYLLTGLVGLRQLGLPSYGDYMIKTTTEINSKNKLSVLAMYNPDAFVRTVDDAKLSKVIENTILANTATNKATFGINLRTLTSKNSYFKNILYYKLIDANLKFGNFTPMVNAQGEFVNKDSTRFENNLQSITSKQSEFGYRSIFTQHYTKATLTAGIDLARIDIDYSRHLSHTDTLYSFTQTDFRPYTTQNYLIILPDYFNSTYKNYTYNGSAYIDFSFKLFKIVALNTGLRYDYTGFTEQQTLSPRLSGSIALSQKQSINFATGIFYQDPLYQDVADQPKENKLKNEKTIQYILGYKNYFSQDLKLVVETWYKQLDDLVLRPKTGQIYLNNDGTGYAYGADFNLTKRLSKKYYGQVGYSYMQSIRDDHNGNGEYNFTYSQPHIASVLISYKPNNKWVFSAKFRYATGRPKDSYTIHYNVLNDPNTVRYSQEITGKNADRLNDYISLDPRVDYRVQVKKLAVTAFVDIVNILNRFNQSSEGLQPITGKRYYDGLGIFPSFGLRVEL
ncbi:MAG: TonB-dependent receptor [Bacteroidia bacterium]